jgi:hypothetical protein
MLPSEEFLSQIVPRRWEFFQVAACDPELNPHGNLRVADRAAWWACKVFKAAQDGHPIPEGLYTTARNSTGQVWHELRPEVNEFLWALDDAVGLARETDPLTIRMEMERICDQLSSVPLNSEAYYERASSLMGLNS